MKIASIDQFIEKLKINPVDLNNFNNIEFSTSYIVFPWKQDYSYLYKAFHIDSKDFLNIDKLSLDGDWNDELLRLCLKTKTYPINLHHAEYDTDSSFILDKKQYEFHLNNLKHVLTKIWKTRHSVDETIHILFENKMTEHDLNLNSTEFIKIKNENI